MKAVVFGSGGLAKELIEYAEERYQILGAVSTEPFNNPTYAAKYEVWLKCPRLPREVVYLMGVADPAIKRKIVSENDDRWVTFVHHTAYVSNYATVGKGCVFGPGSIVCGDPVIGDFVFLNTNATIGHDSRVGSYTTLFPNTEICGDCDVGEDCILGIGSYLLPKVKLPRGTKASAGSVVRKSIESACTLYGDPAKPRLMAA